MVPARRLYFISPFVDFAFVGGASIAAFLLMRLFYTGARTGEVITLGVQLAWICNWPHFSATSYRLYHSRENMAQYPLTSLLVPLAVLAGALGSFASPLLVAPAFVKLVSLWSPYHFSGQSLGVSLVYARRAGLSFERAERFALSAFIYSTFINQTVGFETGAQIFDAHGIGYPSLGLPSWASAASLSWMALTGGALAVLMVRRYFRDRTLIPPIVLLPALTQFIWFYPGARWKSFNEFVPFFHSLQYLLIAWSMQLKEKLDRDRLEPSPGYVASESARWGLLNFLGGAALFWGIPRLVAEAGFPLAFSTGIVVSAVQIHHFFVDGVIWKLKRKTVSSPLLGSVEDLLGPAAARA